MKSAIPLLLTRPVDTLAALLQALPDLRDGDFDQRRRHLPATAVSISAGKSAACRLEVETAGRLTQVGGQGNPLTLQTLNLITIG